MLILEELSQFTNFPTIHDFMEGPICIDLALIEIIDIKVFFTLLIILFGNAASHDQ
jgi:hypothetical protein